MMDLSDVIISQVVTVVKQYLFKNWHTNYINMT